MPVDASTVISWWGHTASVKSTVSSEILVSATIRRGTDQRPLCTMLFIRGRSVRTSSAADASRASTRPPRSATRMSSSPYVRAA